MAAVKERASEGKWADIILVSDTLVEDPDDERAALGKPKDESSAAFSLIRLSGRSIGCGRRQQFSAKIGDIDVGEGWLATIWTDYAIVEFVHMGEDEIIDMINSRSWEGRREDMTWPVLLVNSPVLSMERR